MNKSIIAFALSVVSAISSADILFVDLNNVKQEIAAAREAAAKRGEKVIVIPLESKRYAEYAEMKRTISSLENQQNSACPDGSVSKRCEQMQERLDRLYEDLESKKKFSIEDLKADLAKVSGKVSTVMISGHDGGGNFYGEYGNIDSNKFLDAFSTFPGNADVRSIYLLGCSSATKHTIAQTWIKAFPEAAIVAGYEETGYLRERPEAHQLVKGFLLKEKSILDARDLAEAESIFRKVAPTAQDRSAAACIRREGQLYFMSSNERAEELSQSLKCPSPEKVAEVRERLECFKRATEPCPLSEIKSVKVDQATWKSCASAQFVEGEVDGLADQVRALKYLSGQQYATSFKSIFAKAQLGTRVGPEDRVETVATFDEGKNKLLKIKEEYAAKMNFENLEKLSPNQVYSIVAAKKYTDDAWLAVSNLDLVKLRAVRKAYSETPEAMAPTVRAQAFFEASQRGETTQTLAQRIELLEAKAQDDDGKFFASFYAMEIQVLKGYQK